MCKKLAVSAVALLLAITCAVAAMAQERTVGDLTIGQAWARTTIPGRPGAAYFAVQNRGSVNERILSVSSPMAGRVELHTKMMEGGVMRMREVESIDLPAGERVELRAGGYHVMLFDLHDGMTEGASLPLTITFERAGEVDLVAPVIAAGGAGMSPDGGMSHGPMPESHGGGQ